MGLKVLGIVGSLRSGGNTEFFVKRALDRLAGEGFETELVTLRGKTILPCLGCRGCREKGACVQDTDDFQPIFEKMVEAHGLIAGAPVYFGSAATPIMTLLDRAGYVARMGGKKLFSGKVGAPITVARRAGHNFAFAQLLLWYFVNDMIIPGSLYWNVGTAGADGARDAENDKEGLANIDHFAANMAQVLKKMNS
jgi:multimeric flavodoxin WrbA